VVHVPSEFELDRLEFGLQALGTREPQDHEVALPRHRDASAALAAGRVLRGSMAGTRVPLSTLRPRPHKRARLTRGRRSWRSPQRMTLSFTTSRRH
jgi:hypothetical protein